MGRFQGSRWRGGALRFGEQSATAERKHEATTSGSVTLGEGEKNVTGCIALNLSRSAKRDQTSRVSGEFRLLPSTRARRGTLANQ